MKPQTHLTVLDVSLELERDMFLRTLLRHLAGTLEEVIGLRDASGFVAVVGQQMGDEIDRSYKMALGVERLSRSQVTEVLVDLKRRIQGDFYIIEDNDNRIVLGNRTCPFGDKVVGRPSLCMMTSNVFGRIVSENTGYAKVIIAEAIATGDPGCRVVIYLNPSDGARTDEGREYVRG